MDNLTIRQGARLDFDVYQTDSSAVSATFIAVLEDIEITDTVEYTDGVAHFYFESPDTDIAGEYEYQVLENFATGSPDIYPNTTDCEGDCENPTLTICETLGGES